MGELDYEDLAEKFLTRREADLLVGQASANLDRALVAHQSVHSSESQARDKAEVDVNRRLEDMNQFRGQLRDQAGTFVTRDLFDQHLKENATRLETSFAAVHTRLDAIEALADRREGALSTWRAIAGFLGLSGMVGVLLGLIAVFGPK